MYLNVSLMSVLISCIMLSHPIAAMEVSDDNSASEVEKTFGEKLQDFLRLTPNKKLFSALYWLNVDDIEKSLQAGASLEAKNDDGKTAIEYAREKKLSLLADALENFDENFPNKDALKEEVNKFRVKIRKNRIKQAGINFE